MSKCKHCGHPAWPCRGICEDALKAPKTIRECIDKAESLEAEARNEINSMQRLVYLAAAKYYYTKAQVMLHELEDKIRRQQLKEASILNFDIALKHR